MLFCGSRFDLESDDFIVSFILMCLKQSETVPSWDDYQDGEPEPRTEGRTSGVRKGDPLLL